MNIVSTQTFFFTDDQYPFLSQVLWLGLMVGQMETVHMIHVGGIGEVH